MIRSMTAFARQQAEMGVQYLTHLTVVFNFHPQDPAWLQIRFTGQAR